MSVTQLLCRMKIRQTDGIRRKISSASDLPHDTDKLFSHDTPALERDVESEPPVSSARALSAYSEQPKIQEQEEDSVMAELPRPPSADGIVSDGTNYHYYTRSTGHTGFIGHKILVLKTWYAWSGERRRLIMGLFACAVLLGLGIFSSTTLARLTVTVKPRVEELTLTDVHVFIDSSAAASVPNRRIVPAELLKFPHAVREEFETTGRGIVYEKSRGIVKIFNNFGAVLQPLVARTRFVAPNGAVFRLPRSVVIPQAVKTGSTFTPRFAEAELVADVSGEQSNISGEVKLSIPGFKGTPKYNGFYAIAAEGFKGGLTGEVPMPSRDDRKKAEELITKRVVDETNKQIIDKLPPNFTVVEGLRETRITKLTIPPEKREDGRFAVETEALGRVLVFRQADMERLVKEVLLGNDQSRAFVDRSLALQYQIKNTDFTKGKAELIVNGKVKVTRVIAPSEIASVVRHQKEKVIIDALRRREDLATFSLSFFPPWLERAPSNEEKIRLTIEEGQ